MCQRVDGLALAYYVSDPDVFFFQFDFVSNIWRINNHNKKENNNTDSDTKDIQRKRTQNLNDKQCNKSDFIWIFIRY